LQRLAWLARVRARVQGAGCSVLLYSLAGTAVRGRPPCECVGVAGGRVWLGVRAVSERAVTNNGVGGAGRRAEEDR
jgi:hypothetical protein